MATTGKVVFKRGLFVDLPSSAEKNVLLFVEDQGRLFKGNGIGKPLTEFSNIMSGYNNLETLENLNPAIRGKIYVTCDNKLYTYDGVNYVSLGGNNGLIDHNKLLNRGTNNQHPISAITGLENQLTQLNTKIENVRFRGFYKSPSKFPNSVSMNRDGDIAVSLVNGNYTLYAYSDTTYQWEQIGTGTDGNQAYENIVNPRITDDIDAGFEIGDIWINTTNKTGYICADNKVKNAIWRLITLDDISAFTTADLTEAKGKYFVSSADKSNLLQLQSIINTQTNIQNQINTIGEKIANDASPSNKLVSKNTLNNKIKNSKFEDLLNTPTILSPDTFLVVDSTGTKVIMKDTFDQYIQSIKDKNNVDFTKVKKLEFSNLQGNLKLDETLLLTARMYSTDILDMPTTFDTNKILVSDANSLSYKLKSIDELALLQENYNVNITSDNTDWVNPSITSSGKYEFILKHGLDSQNIIAMFYDINNILIDVKYKILNNMEILIMLDNPIDIRVVVNCSQGTSSEQLTNAKPQITASDFVDDIHTRIDKTYSSKKIEDMVFLLANKENIYNKTQANNIFASKTLEHSHANLYALNNLQEDTDGNLTYKGSKLMTQVEPFYHEDHWVNEDYIALKQLIDMRTIYNTLNFTTIVNSEFTIKNLKPSTTPIEDEDKALRLVVMDDTITILDVKILPQEVQKYLLGISPNTKVFVEGCFSANYYVSAF